MFEIAWRRISRTLSTASFKIFIQVAFNNMTAFYILLVGHNFQLVIRPFVHHLSTEFMNAQKLKSRTCC
jgi:hypothetical protein